MTRAEFLTDEIAQFAQADALQKILGETNAWWLGYMDHARGDPRSVPRRFDNQDGTEYDAGYEVYPHYQMIQDGPNWRKADVTT